LEAKLVEQQQAHSESEKILKQKAAREMSRALHNLEREAEKLQREMKEEADEVLRQTRAKAQAEQQRLVKKARLAVEQELRGVMVRSESRAVAAEQELREEMRREVDMKDEELQAIRREVDMRDEELRALGALAAMMPVEKVPDLNDVDLRELEEAARREHTRRAQAKAHREARREMRQEMWAEMEREPVAREEERLCEICLDKAKDTSLACGHLACAACHVCRAPIADTDRRSLY
jgi:hypothetical protein